MFNRKRNLALVTLLLLGSLALSPSQLRANEARSFTDSVKRSVTVDAVIEKIAPSGPLAQVVLYTAFPDKLCGLSRPLSKRQMAWLPEEYHNLPVFGQFYGKNTTLNKEALLLADPDVIVDIGEAKKSIVQDMNDLQEQLQIPTVFIEARLTDMPSAYRKIAELLGEIGKTEELAAWCQQTLDKAKAITATLSDDDRVSVYWAMGDKGLNTNAEQSFQSEVLQLVGADNVAKVEAVSRSGGSEVSFEQLLQWKPRYVLADNEAVLKVIQSDPSWQAFLKDSNATVVLVPDQPYGLLANPPSVNQILGISWLGQLLYPGHYQLDMKKEFKEFYQLFYSVTPSEEQLADLTASLQNAQ